MIRVEGITKRFGDRLALENVSFEVEQGEIMGFLGPNGAGKTTTMRIITGYLPPSEGRVTVDGFDILEQPREVKRRVGYLPEVPPLYNELLVDEYLDYAAALRGVPRNRRAERVKWAAERCGLVDVRRRLINNLSKGYRQRVGLAQALVHDPHVVILDEPTAGLDPNQIQDFRALLREVAQERTVILSTHILPEVEAVCNKVAIINRGKIIAVDRPENLTAGTTPQRRMRLRIARPPAVADLEREFGAVDGIRKVSAAGEHLFDVELGGEPEARERLAAAVVEKGWGLLEMREESARLEDVFHRLTVEQAAASEAPREPVEPETEQAGEPPA